MSDYEKQRIARKKENAAMLAALGLSVPASKNDQDEEDQAEEEEIQDDPDMLADFDDSELFGTAEENKASNTTSSGTPFSAKALLTKPHACHAC